MRVVRFGAAVVCLVLAVGAALLASDVRTWERTAAAGDAALAVDPARASWRSSTLVQRLLGVRDDIAARRALASFRNAASVEQRLDNATRTQALRGRAESELADIARDPNRARASQAETLLGVLVFTDLSTPDNPFQSSTGPAPDQVEEAVADFQNAVRDDPSNATAKFDLELVIRTLAAQGTRVGSSQQSGAGSIGKRGAGGGVPGSGY